MIRDYPDVVPTSISVPPSPPATSTSFQTPSPASSVSNLSITLPPSTPTLSVPNPPFVHSSPVPPPRHPTASMQTTYTPYVPRARRGKDVATAATNPLSPTGQHIPIITSSSQGGVTTRHPTPGGSGTASGDGYRHDAGPSAALLGKVRALDSLPRLGALKTLDLKGNDLRVSIMSRFLEFSHHTDCFFFPRRVFHILPRSSNGIELSKF
jgi:protein phosphatase 1 regulatory subunit 37